ncbi:MAG: VCBS repeat-containing protein [Deltaproteobacteria bacterium]|nr:VCBS repeat-containing protein [Deltaproteobacteria bacterium]
MKSRTLVRVLILSCVAVLWSVQGWALSTAQIAKDFSSVSGYVVMATGSEYIIDLDSAQGVAAGDLFSVVTKGGNIVHPVTKKIIGTLDTVSAVLKVTRIKSGYSYAVKVRGDGDLSAGTEINRFDSVNATFQDQTGNSEVLKAELMTALPSLQWQGDSQLADADLAFVATAAGVQVRDSSGQLLRSYQTGQTIAAPVPSTMNLTAAVPQVAVPQVAMAQQGPVTYQSRSQVGGFGTSALNMQFPRFVKVGQFDTTTVMSDFEKFNDQLYLASTDGSAIKVYRVGETIELAGQGDSITMGQILSVSWWQPQGDPALYLVVTVWGDDRVESDLLRWDGQAFSAVKKGFNRFLAGFDADGNGTSELLIGQDFDREMFYASRFNAYSLNGDTLVRSELQFKLPKLFRVISGLLSDVTGDGQPEAIFIRNRRLYVYAGENQLYKSSKEMGASLSGVTYDIDPSAQNPMITSASCAVAPVAADLDGDGKPEIVAISAEGTYLQAAGVSSSINKSWLSVLKYQDGMMMKGTLGDKLERPIQGLAVDNGKAIMVATDVAGILDGAAASYVLAVPVQ